LRKLQRRDLIKQAKDFYKETRYIPSNYDALFHTKHFSSPVTIRKHFGSWENYIDEAFDNMVLMYINKMFYGGYGINYKTVHPYELDPMITVENKDYNILGELNYTHLAPNEVWVVKTKWGDIIEILLKQKIEFEVIPADKKYLFPYVVVRGGTIAIATFDTPHIKGHHSRITRMIDGMYGEYETVLNLNGVKKNHISKEIERFLDDIPQER